MTIYPDNINDSLMAALADTRKQLNRALAEAQQLREEGWSKDDRIAELESALEKATAELAASQGSKKNKGARPKRASRKGKQADPPPQSDQGPSYW